MGIHANDSFFSDALARARRELASRASGALPFANPAGIAPLFCDTTAVSLQGALADACDEWQALDWAPTSDAAIQQATAALDSFGADYTRVRASLRRALQPGGRLSILILGGSASEGNGCTSSKANRNMSDAPAPGGARWGDRLEVLLRWALPSASTVKVVTQRAHGVGFMLQQFATLRPEMYDLVIVEHASNDPPLIKGMGSVPELSAALANKVRSLFPSFRPVTHHPGESGSPVYPTCGRALFLFLCSPPLMPDNCPPPLTDATRFGYRCSRRALR